MKKTPIPKIKTVKKSVLIKELDRVFSLFIRHRDHYVCCTCGKSDPARAQNGHYIPRAHMNTRWDEENCHCQCVHCNVFMKGKMADYAIFIVDKYGADHLKELDKRKKQIRQWTSKELIEATEYYKKKLSDLINA